MIRCPAWAPWLGGPWHWSLQQRALPACRRAPFTSLTCVLQTEKLRHDWEMLTTQSSEGAESCCVAGPRHPLGKSKPREGLAKGGRRMLRAGARGLCLLRSYPGSGMASKSWAVLKHKLCRWHPSAWLGVTVTLPGTSQSLGSVLNEHPSICSSLCCEPWNSWSHDEELEQ